MKLTTIPSLKISTIKSTYDPFKITSTPTFKLKYNPIKYDPKIMAMASKFSNIPSAQTVQNQAVIQSPRGAGFFSDLWGVAKDVLMTIPVAFTVGGYRITRPMPTPVSTPTSEPAPKPFIEQYMPYILIGGVGVILLIVLRR